MRVVRLVHGGRMNDRGTEDRAAVVCVSCGTGRTPSPASRTARPVVDVRDPRVPRIPATPSDGEARRRPPLPDLNVPLPALAVRIGACAQRACGVGEDRAACLMGGLRAPLHPRGRSPCDDARPGPDPRPLIPVSPAGGRRRPERRCAESNSAYAENDRSMAPGPAAVVRHSADVGARRAAWGRRFLPERAVASPCGGTIPAPADGFRRSSPGCGPVYRTHQENIILRKV